MKIIFTPGEDFESLLGRASFNLVASRTTQSASLKAEKAGETTVDLAVAKNKVTGPTDPADPTDPDNGGGSTPEPSDPETGGSGSDAGEGEGGGLGA